jgi:hypothetical protein
LFSSCGGGENPGRIRGEGHRPRRALSVRRGSGHDDDVDAPGGGREDDEERTVIIR